MSPGGVGALLLEPAYRRFLAETHPELEIDDARLEVPSFVAPLDIREPLRPGATRRLVTAFTSVTPSYVVPRSLFLGTPFERYDQTHLLDEVDDPVALAEDAGAAARAERLEMVVVCNVSPSHRRLRAWLDAGFTELPSFPDTLVDLDVDGFEAHLMRLPQADRSGVRRNIRRFQRAGHRLEPATRTRDIGDVLYAGYRPFFEKATVRWQPHSRAYFHGLGELDPRVHVTVAKTEADEVAGFIVVFEDGEGVQAGRVGITPRFSRRDAIYFRLIYHAVEQAFWLRQGRGRLSLEPTGYRMKRHLGAWSRPMVNLVLGVSPRWRALLGGFAGLGRRLLAHLEDREALERAY